jgi:hypothetical protein
LEDGTARCWGWNGYGQLGDGTTTTLPWRYAPVVVFGLNNVRSMSVGFSHTCAVLENGTACCWGEDWHGELGDGTNTNSMVPVVVTGVTNVRSISAKVYHVCATSDDGTARCWGSNDSGQLGDGTRNDSNVPVVVSGCAPAPTTSNYTECRQVIASGSLQMHNKPCFDATYSLKVTIARCERFEYLAAAKPRVSECASQGDFSCWIEVVHKGTRGWIMASTGTNCAGGDNPSATALVAYCPAASCPIRGEV